MAILKWAITVQNKQQTEAQVLHVPLHLIWINWIFIRLSHWTHGHNYPLVLSSSRTTVQCGATENQPFDPKHANHQSSSNGKTFQTIICTIKKDNEKQSWKGLVSNPINNNQHLKVYGKRWTTMRTYLSINIQTLKVNS